MPLFGKEHVKRYQETNGEEGYNWEKGTTTLLLTTTGRKSGEPRTTPLIFRDWDDKYLVVASKGGADKPPLWWRNIKSDSTVQVQIKGEKFTATARAATKDEQPALWKRMTEAWPDYDEYQKKTDRQIPVVVLERS